MEAIQKPVHPDSRLGGRMKRGALGRRRIGETSKTRLSSFDDRRVSEHGVDLGNYPVFSRSEHAELARRAREESDTKAREQLILHNMRFMTRIVRQYCGYGVDFDDLLQEGVIGLITAVDRFDERKGFTLSTYAEYWIRNSMQRALMKAKVVEPAEWMHEKARSIKKIARRFLRDTGRPATTADIAESVGESEARVAEILQADNVCMISLDAPVADHGSPLHDAFPDTAGFSPLDMALVWEQWDRCRGRLRAFCKKVRTLKKIQPRNIGIFFRYYGLDGTLERCTQRVVADEYGICHTRIGQIVDFIWRRLHRRSIRFNAITLCEEMRVLKELSELMGEIPHFSEE